MLVRTRVRKQCLEVPCVDGRTVLKWILKKWDGRGGGGMDWIDLVQDRDRCWLL
jgi:hypothetical protein